MSADAFIEPLDVLTLRGNRLFGDAGSWGESLMPPPPSVAAGALRSHLLATAGTDPSAFAERRTSHPALGSLDKPGPFTLAEFQLARHDDGGAVEPLLPLPADLVVSAAGGTLRIDRLHPSPPPAGIDASLALPCWPVLAQAERAKPATGLWLSGAGSRAWLRGEPLDAARHLVPRGELWQTEERVGVGLDALRRRADDGRLFSLQAVACHRGVGFAVRVHGASLADGMLRLGGDGRGAHLQTVPIAWPEPDWPAIAAAGRARLLLTAPGLFARGWLPVGCGAADRQAGAAFDLHGVRGRIVCAALPRLQVISGFDLARGRPKPAQRAVPAGTVYWIDDLQATTDALRKLADIGLWPAADYDDPRRAEGFNRCTIGAW